MAGDPRLTGLWWWVDRWRKSTAFMDMTLEQQGAYRNLLDEASLRGGPLPNDDRILAKACGDAKRWPKVRAVVMARFALHADGWHNATLDEVIAESARLRKLRAEAGRNGATNRWQTDSKPDGKPDGKDDGKPDSKPIAPDPSPDPSPENSARTIARAHAVAAAVTTNGQQVERTIGHLRETVATTRDVVDVTAIGVRPRGGGVCAGSLPRDHAEHVFCDYAHCVPRAVHAKLCGLLSPKHQGDQAAAGDELEAWYPTVVAALAPHTVMGDAFKFWQSRFDAVFATPDPVKPEARDTPEAMAAAAIAILKKREAYQA